MRDFLTKYKNEIKFVISYHSTGNMWVIPFSGKKPKGFDKFHKDVKNVIGEIVEEAHFPPNMKIGSSA